MILGIDTKKLALTSLRRYLRDLFFTLIFEFANGSSFLYVERVPVALRNQITSNTFNCGHFLRVDYHFFRHHVLVRCFVALNAQLKSAVANLFSVVYRITICEIRLKFFPFSLFFRGSRRSIHVFKIIH